MRIEISKSQAEGVIKAPPAKSFAHRQIICAALANGKSVVHGVYNSEDVLATLDCAHALGADIRVEGDTAYIDGRKYGLKKDMYCRESGSTLRFLIPVCLCFGRDFVFHGSERLMERPLDEYKKLCESQGVTFEQRDGKLYTDGRIKVQNLSVSGAVSSQFITGLLLAAPLTNKDSTIKIEPPLVSRPYVNITVDVMEQMGVHVQRPDEYTLFVKGGQSYKPHEFTVEGDWSNGAFLEALGALSGKVRVTGLNENSKQGDKVCKEFFKLMKEGRPTLDIADCPDNAPVLMALAAALNGVELTSTARLRAKESDRGRAMAAELSKFGAKVRVFEDSIEVDPGIHAPTTVLFGHNDHRIVMALSVLLTVTGGIIYGAEAVNKSYPGFFDDIASLHVGVTKWN